MLNKILPVYFFSAIFFTAGIAAFADESNSTLDEQQKKVDAYIRDKELKYKLQLDQLAQKMYDRAVSLYNDKKYHLAKDAFEQVEATDHNYLATSNYLKIVDRFVATEDAQSAKEAEAARVKLDEIKYKVELGHQLKEIYGQAVVLYERQKLAEAKIKFEEVNKILPDYRSTIKYLDLINNAILDEQQKALQEQGRQEEMDRQREVEFQAEKEAKAPVSLEDQQKQAQEIAVLADRSAQLYHQIADIADDEPTVQTKKKMAEVDDILSNLKENKERLLRQMKEEQLNHQQEEQKAQQAEHEVEVERMYQQEQDKQHLLEQQQQASLKELAQKASSINDDIILLSHSQDYEAMKAKFTELENTVAALTALKVEIARQKGQEREKELAREAVRQSISSEGRDNGQIQVLENQQQIKENRSPASQPPDIEPFKRREMMQEQNSLYREGVDCYEHRKYTQAKLLFDELAQQHDRRAEAWLKKVDRAITQELLKSQEAEERERTAFIADQLKAQRELFIIQDRERQRQKKLTEELERQKRLYEDDQLLQLRKEETMKAQELERQRQEEKRLKLEKESEKQQEMFRFHKVEVVAQQTARPAASQIETRAGEVKPQVQAQPAPPMAGPATVQPVVPKPAVATTPPLINLIQRFFQGQPAQVQPEISAQEQKRKEEILSQQDQQREEKIEQDKIVREEAQRREELERQERQSQSQLEAQRESVRKQLEDGVEAMYQEALSLYKQGDYSQAADRFKDVQDILPGYKRSEEYMDEARSRSLAVNPQAGTTPDISKSSTNASATPVATVVSPSASHQDSVSKALDLFDPNAQ